MMAFFGAPFRPKDHAQRAVRAALDIVAGMETMGEVVESLRVGGGVGTGETYVGNVAEGEVRDFTVIGDVVNTAARLQGQALAGEVLIMEETYFPLAAQFPEAPQRTLELPAFCAPVLQLDRRLASLRLASVRPPKGTRPEWLLSGVQHVAVGYGRGTQCRPSDFLARPTLKA